MSPITLGNSTSKLWEYGCGVASLAMVFRYHGVDTNLVELNETLIEEDGFSGAYLAWDIIQKPETIYAVGDGILKSIQRINTSTPANFQERVDQSLLDGEPVIAYLNERHYVVIVGKDGDTYRINDPWAGKNTANSGTNIPIEDNLLGNGGFNSIKQFVFISPHANAPTNNIVVHERIVDKYIAMFGSQGPLGNPTDRATRLPGSAGWWQQFDGGSIMAPDGQPPIALWGPIWQVYQEEGGIEALGLPKIDTYIYFSTPFGGAIWRADFAETSIIWNETEDSAQIASAQENIRTEYFANPNLEGNPAYVRFEEDWLFDWQNGSPAPFVSSDTYSIRFTQEDIDTFGLQQFVVASSGKVRITINDDIVYDSWTGEEDDVNFTNFFGPGSHKFVIEYQAPQSSSYLKLGWAGWPVGVVFADQAAVGPYQTPTANVTDHVNLGEETSSAPSGCDKTAVDVGLNLVLPIEAGGNQLKTFGSVYNSPPLHLKQDLCALDFDSEGLNVVAVADGVVQQARWYEENVPSEGFGYYVQIKHDTTEGETYHSFYAHLKDPATVPEECRVTTGQPVQAGDCLGVTGATGYSNPPETAHLHFSMFHDDYLNGTHVPYNGTPLAPETMKGLFLYSTLSAYEPVTTIATAKHIDTVLPETEFGQTGVGAFVLQPNETAVVTFVFHNTSKLTWDQSNRFELVQIDGDAPGASDRILLLEPVASGENASLRLSITGQIDTDLANVPLDTYQSTWQLHHNDVPFGPPVELRYAVTQEIELPTIDIIGWLTSMADVLLDNLWSAVLSWLDPVLAPFNQLWHEIQQLLALIDSLCATVPVTILFGLAVFNKFKLPKFERLRKALAARPKDDGKKAFRKAVQAALTFLLTEILVTTAQELLLWPDPVREAGIVALILAAAAFVLSIVLLARFILSMGWRRLSVVMLVIFAFWTVWHGQQYYANRPVITRVIESVEDVAALSENYLQDRYRGLESVRDDIFSKLLPPSTSNLQVPANQSAFSNPQQNEVNRVFTFQGSEKPI